jgi:hypothetical protein
MLYQSTVFLAALLLLAGQFVNAASVSSFTPINGGLKFGTSANAETTTFGSELSNLPFQRIFAGPLMAVVNAQAASADKTHKYINEIGFTTDLSNPDSPKKSVMYVEFNYQSFTTNGTAIQRRMQVPFLYMVPIPFLTIDSVTIELNVKLTNVADRTDVKQITSNEVKYDVNYHMWGRRCWVCATVSYGTVSSQETTKSSTRIQQTFSLNVAVHAAQAPLPGGMERILELFESLVNNDQPISNSTTP